MKIFHIDSVFDQPVSMIHVVPSCMITKGLQRHCWLEESILFVIIVKTDLTYVKSVREYKLFVFIDMSCN